MGKDKPVNDVMRVIMLSSLKFFRTQVLKRIDDQNEHLEKGVEISFMPVEDIILALNDDNPDNKEQVTAIILEWINGPVADLIEDIFTDLIEKNDDENLKAVFSQVLMLGIQVLKVYTDNDEKNKEQLKLIFDKFIESPETQVLLTDNILKPVLVKIIKDEKWAEYIVNLVKNSLASLQRIKDSNNNDIKLIQ
jgi:predicted RND superfamily exporter protein